MKVKETFREKLFFILTVAVLRTKKVSKKKKEAEQDVFMAVALLNTTLPLKPANFQVELISKNHADCRFLALRLLCEINLI